MANLADLDPSFSVPCRRCSALLQKGNRFCPFCFEDQFAERDAGDASPPVDGGRADVAAAPRPGRLIIDFADTGPPGAEEAIQIPGPAGASLEEAGSEIGFVRPGLFSATEDLPGDGARGGARFATPRRLVIGVACALVLVALPAGLRRAYFDVPPAGVHAALKPLAEPPAQAPPEPPVEPAAPVPAALPEAPVAIDPEPAGSKAAVGNKGCSEALAAMALCPGQ